MPCSAKRVANSVLCIFVRTYVSLSKETAVFGLPQDYSIFSWPLIHAQFCTSIYNSSSHMHSFSSTTQNGLSKRENTSVPYIMCSKDSVYLQSST